MTDLRDRIDHAINRVTAAKAAEEVLAEIAKTHRLVPRELCEQAGANLKIYGRGSYHHGELVAELAGYATSDQARVTAIGERVG